MTLFNSVYLKDENGVAYGVKQISNRPRVSAVPYLYDVSKGIIPNHQSDKIIGYNPAVGATLTDISPLGLINFPAAPQQMRIVSSSGNDTAAGTGVRTVALHYLDNNLVPQLEYITLNGVTPVNTVATNIRRIHNLHTATAGSNNAAVGNISLQNTAGTLTYDYISAGFNTSEFARYTIPAGSVGFLTGLSFSASSGNQNSALGTRMLLRMTQHYEVALTAGLFITHYQAIMHNSVLDTSFEAPIKVLAGVDVKVSAIALGAVTNWVAVSLRGWLEPA